MTMRTNGKSLLNRHYHHHYLVIISIMFGIMFINLTTTTKHNQTAFNIKQLLRIVQLTIDRIIILSLKCVFFLAKRNMKQVNGQIKIYAKNIFIT